MVLLSRVQNSITHSPFWRYLITFAVLNVAAIFVVSTLRSWSSSSPSHLLVTTSSYLRSFNLSNTMTGEGQTNDSGDHDFGTNDEVSLAEDIHHKFPHHHLSHSQRTLLFVLVATFSLWIIRRFLCKFNPFGNFSSLSSSQSSSSSLSSSTTPTSPRRNKSNIDLAAVEKGAGDSLIRNEFNNGSDSSRGNTHQGKNHNSDEDADSKYSNKNDHSVVEIKLDVAENLKDRVISAHNGSIAKSQASSKGQASQGQSSGPPEVSLDQFLTKAVLFGAIMIYFYLCDYYKVFPQGKREYTRDTFLFLVFLLFLVASFFTLKPNSDKILNRDQTEEWKGWMQVMFVWYHYFSAKEWYNWIRVYIACYVWMTGFGNFSFFWVRKDFSLWRMLKMLFRLNFLVIFVAMVTNNEYMLYYICAMHTYWFFSVYAFMRVLNSWNTDRVRMAVKFLAYAVFNAIVFDIPGVSEEVFRPFRFILGRHDNNDEVMHEWSFRAGLDHWACFLGMLCAYNYPTVEKFSNYLDSKSSGVMERLKKLGVRVVIGVVAFAVGVAWYFGFMTHEKYAYNATHPYSSMLPILIFIVLRNIHPVLRSYHLGLFSWLGKITLETYLSQLHIYLLANATSLLVYIPESPLLNFSLATIIYIFVSHCLFNITNDTSNFLIPKDHKKVMINITIVVALFGASAFVSYAFF